jgi:2'-5' RNA ligase
VNGSPPVVGSGNGSAVRAFAALPLPSSALEELGNAGRRLRAATRSLRVVQPAGLHVTLIFFGELEKLPLARVERALDDPALVVAPIDASIGGLGQFPPKGAPRVLYCPILRGAGEITALHRRLQASLAASWVADPPAPTATEGAAPLVRPPWDDPRPFTPHVTVARARGGQVELAELRGFFDFEHPLLLDRLVLFQSLLGPGGAQYRALKTVHLAGEGKQA